MRRRLCYPVILFAVFSFACGEAGPADTPTSSAGDNAQTIASAQTSADSAPTLEWTRQIEASAKAEIRAVGADGNIYVGGLLGGGGALDGFPDVGQGPDAFIRAYDADGNELWSDVIALRRIDSINAIVVNSTGVYAIGGTSFASAMQGVRTITFIRKYSPDGTELWTEEFRFAGRRMTIPRDAAIDDTGIYVSGTVGSSFAPGEPSHPFDAFAIKFDLDGNLVWSQRLDVKLHDAANGIAVSSAGVSLSGASAGDGTDDAGDGTDDADAFAAHLDADGNLVWLDQFGSTADDVATDVAVTAGRIHVSGWTDGALEGETNLGGRDAFVRTYDVGGSVQWIDQFGTAREDNAHAIASDATDLFVVGELGGDDAAEGRRAYVRKFDAAGQPSWTFLFDNADLAFASAVALDGDAIYVAGGDTLAKLLQAADEEPPGDDDDDDDDDGEEPPEPPEPPTDCETVEGDVVINRLADTSQLDAVEGCFDIQGHLFVQDADDISDLSFLSGLRSVTGYVGIADNVGLLTLAGLDDLESVGEGLVIEGNPDLQTITNLGSLETVAGEIHIFGNPSLTQIALPALLSAGELLVAGNDALLTLSAAQLVSIDMRLLIENNDVLHTVDLSSLQDVGSVRVRFNPALDNFLAPGLN